MRYAFKIKLNYKIVRTFKFKKARNELQYSFLYFKQNKSLDWIIQNIIIRVHVFVLLPRISKKMYPQLRYALMGSFWAQSKFCVQTKTWLHQLTLLTNFCHTPCNWLNYNNYYLFVMAFYISMLRVVPNWLFAFSEQ